MIDSAGGPETGQVGGPNPASLAPPFAEIVRTPHQDRFEASAGHLLDGRPDAVLTGSPRTRRPASADRRSHERKLHMGEQGRRRDSAGFR